MGKWFFLLLGCFPYSLFAQQAKSKTAFQVQLEGMGVAGLVSLNMDSRFSGKENGLGYRMGIGAVPKGFFCETCNSGVILSVPLGINYLIGSRQHKIEAGAGVVFPVIDGGTKRGCEEPVKGFFSDETSTWLFSSVGYRYQPFREKGFVYRAFISPLFQSEMPVKFWGGASIGYRL